MDCGRGPEPNAWQGYSGEGDYAKANGNTWEVAGAAHRLRDGDFDADRLQAEETGETYDLIVVGGGMSGLAAAFYFQKEKRAGQRCLVLDNHSVFGGEAKGNEFLVNGQRLWGPQGSNWIFPPVKGTWVYDFYREIRLDVDALEYQSWDPHLRPLEFDRGHYKHHARLMPACFGYYFGAEFGKQPGQWVTGMWEKKLEDTPFSEKVKRDLWAFKYSIKRPNQLEGDDLLRWLDSMTVRDLIEKVHGLDAAVTRFADPLVATQMGMGCDVTSARPPAGVIPGYQMFAKSESDYLNWQRYRHALGAGFPGGNSQQVRHVVKAMIPGAIEGNQSVEDIFNKPINFGALDRPENDVRLRLACMVVRVEHLGNPEHAEHIQVTYLKNGRLYRVQGRTAIMAGGGWVTKYVVRGLPPTIRDAYESFAQAPMLVANVAVTNWRFMYELGISGGFWFHNFGSKLFGYYTNLRQQALIGDYRPRLHPDAPNVLTFYVPHYYPGMSAKEQGHKGRMEIMSRSYRDYELWIRESLRELFGPTGFKSASDIAGIILNRWGHAYIVPEPGFYYGSNGNPPMRDVIRKRPFGRVAFAHSEVTGFQGVNEAVAEGFRALKQVMEVMGQQLHSNVEFDS
jgi:spermidine dehydrogenase